MDKRLLIINNVIAIIVLTSIILSIIPVAHSGTIAMADTGNSSLAGPIVIGVLNTGFELNMVYADPYTGGMLLIGANGTITLAYGERIGYTSISPVDGGLDVLDFKHMDILYGNSTILVLYNATSGSSTVVYRAAHGYSIVDATFDPSQRVMAVALDNGAVEIRDIETGSLLARRILASNIERLDLQHGFLIAYYRGDTVSFYSLGLQPVVSLHSSGGTIHRVVVNPTGSSIAIATASSIEVYNRYGTLLYTVNSSSPYAAWSPDGSMLLVAYNTSSLDYLVVLAADGRPLNAVMLDTTGIMGLSWAGNIVVADSKGTVYYLRLLPATGETPYSVTSISWSPFSDHLVAGYYNSVSVVDSSLNTAWTLELPYRVMDVADGPSFIVAATSNGTYVIDHLGSVVCKLDTGLTKAVARLGGGLFAFTGVHTGIIDAGSCIISAVFELPRGFVGSDIVGSRQAGMAVVAGVTGDLVSFDIDTGLTAARTSINSSITGLAYNPARGLIAVASSNGLMLLDADTLALLSWHLKGASLSGVALHPSGLVAAVIGVGRPVLVDLAGNMTVPVSVPYARAIAWSPSGVSLAVGYESGIAIVEAPTSLGEVVGVSPVVRPLVVEWRNTTRVVTETVTEVVTVTETVEPEPIVKEVTVTETVTETLTKTVVEKETVVIENTTTVTVAMEKGGGMLSQFESWYSSARDSAREYGIDLDVMVMGIGVMVLTLLVIVFIAKASAGKSKG